jgi:3-hydroxyisobutyrate dehydrogenase-like beta-hydroxyacid dehydrogenase
MEAFARRVLYVGEFGTGSKLKFIANLLVAIHNVSTAEAIVLGEKAGIDPTLLFDAIAGSGGTSRMFEVRGRMMQAGAYDQTTMKVEVFAKDIEIISAFADSLGMPTPLFSTSAWFYTAALAEGRAAEDTAAVAAIVRRMAGTM